MSQVQKYDCGNCISRRLIPAHGAPKAGLAGERPQSLDRSTACFWSRSGSGDDSHRRGAHPDCRSVTRPARPPCFNPRHAEDVMALSLQAGLAELSTNWPNSIQAALVALGHDLDRDSSCSGGHYRIPGQRCSAGPAQLPDASWASLYSPPLAVVGNHGAYPTTDFARFISANAQGIHYLTVDRASILRDLDTPEDYEQQAPREHCLLHSGNLCYVQAQSSLKQKFIERYDLLILLLWTYQQMCCSSWKKSTGRSNRARLARQCAGWR